MSLQQIRRRIKSIGSTAQITKAMELVAAAKMRKAQEQNDRSRPYSQHGREIIELLTAKVDRKFHPLLAQRPIHKIILIVVTSDKGLAGSYNTLVVREVSRFINENKDRQIDIVTVGKKGERALLSLGKRPIATFADLPTHPTFADITPIAKIGLDGFIKGDYDQVVIAYTHFVSTIRQEIKLATLLPISATSSEVQSGSQAPIEYKFEPSQDKVLDYILPRMIETNFYQFLLEAIASEHSARMVAMKNATDNAQELIDDLRLTYNSVRQAKITQELTEIATATEAIS